MNNGNGETSVLVVTVEMYVDDVYKKYLIHL